MKEKFKKITAIVSSMFMVGSTIGMAMAAGGAFPVPFVQNSNADYAIVYGANAAASDITASNLFNAYLNEFYSIDEGTNNDDTTNTNTGTNIKTNVTSDFSSAVSLLDEISLGSDILSDSKFRATLEDNKLPGLLDTKVNWDNGDGSENYDIHEEIILTKSNGATGLDVITNLNHQNGEDLDSYVVFQNDESLGYRLIFDDTLDYSTTDRADADDLTVTILGKEYDITNFDNDFSDITISQSEEKVVKEGEVLNIEGITLNIGTIFEEDVEINGVLVKNGGSSKKINGLEVEVTNTAMYSDNSLSKAVIKVGKDIERTISDGDEYIKDDETWVWDIGDDGGIGEDKQYIGVRYIRSNTAYDEDEPEDNPLIEGQSYIFPENYAAVSFNGLTDVSYEEFDVYFDSKTVYIDATSQGPKNLVIIEGENDDSITFSTNTYGEIETDTLYYEYDGGDISMYFKDIDGDVNSDKKGKIQLVEANVGTTKLIVGDTELKVSIEDDNKSLVLTNDILEEDNTIEVAIREVNGTSFTKIGENSDDAESGDVWFGGQDVSTTDYDVMNNYGTIMKNPENQADDDKVSIRIPSEQVFAEISVKGQGKTIITTVEEENTNSTTNNTTTTTPTTTTPKLGGILVKDTEIQSVKDKNLILVGGSCINSAVASILGGKFCGEDFTLNTGVTNGQALIKSIASPSNANKVAIIVAGYSAADTTKGVNYVINNDVDLAVGQKLVI